MMDITDCWHFNLIYWVMLNTCTYVGRQLMWNCKLIWLYVRMITTQIMIVSAVVHVCLCTVNTWWWYCWLCLWCTVGHLESHTEDRHLKGDWLCSRLLAASVPVLVLLAVVISQSVTLKQISRVRPIPVSGIGRYLPVSAGIGIGRYLF